MKRKHFIQKIKNLFKRLNFLALSSQIKIKNTNLNMENFFITIFEYRVLPRDAKNISAFYKNYILKNHVLKIYIKIEHLIFNVLNSLILFIKIEYLIISQIKYFITISKDIEFFGISLNKI